MNNHRCRWTNAAVEGRNNRMNASQRKRYFTRNKAVCSGTYCRVQSSSLLSITRAS
ncbi:hypothetical protein [Paenibacillus sp. KS1]|uniref:hypothetical protein n=1 Tax=Paenibacillus sp. KS1 TaxID=1849249 RepID=UPI0034A0BAD0